MLGSWFSPAKVELAWVISGNNVVDFCTFESLSFELALLTDC